MRCGLWRRTFAYLIDGFAIGFITGILSRLGIGTAIEISNLGGIFRNQTMPALLAAAVYFLLFAYFNEGRTIGKSLLNMEVESMDGGKLERDKLMFREGVKVLLLPLSIVSFILCLFTQNKSAIHDLLLNTIVIKNT